MKYPLMRFGHWTERQLRKHLYIDFSGRSMPRYNIPESVPVPDHSHALELPVLGD